MAELLKNIYDEKYISKLADDVKVLYEDFYKNDFINSIFDNTWKDLELKDRMRHIALNLSKAIPLSYEKQLDILKEVSKEYFSYEAMFFQDFVEVFGLDDYEESIKALEVFTQDSSSEFAIRAFILKYEDKTMAKMKEWTKSENEHLRRLASEGCRPRLPWAVSLPRFKKDPSLVFEIIELLKYDKSKYVQKSLANNLNDISKDNPNLVVEFVKNNLGVTKELDFICKHGSRTLLKKGDIRILELFGYKKAEHISIRNFMVDKSVKLGEDLNFYFELISKESLGNIRVEYVVKYLKYNNKSSKKIFMLYQKNEKQNNKSFSKKQSFKDMTTRKHYKGAHSIAIVINGEVKVEKEFELI